MDQLITPAEALARILASLSPLPAEPIALAQAIGRTLREPLIADRDFPPFDRATMDGVACRLAEIEAMPVTIQGYQAAGIPSLGNLLPGHGFEISTGAVVPHDCDHVIPVEEITRTARRAALTSSANADRKTFIHRKGSDCKKGHELVPANTRLNPQHLALAATIGKAKLLVTREPRITLLTTGDELVPIAEKPAPHQIRQSHATLLQSSLADLGYEPENFVHHHLFDEPEEIEKAVATALQDADLVLLTGGVSKGSRDFVTEVVSHHCGTPTLHGIAQRPGKPLAYWAAAEKRPPVFGLPGNPNSVAHCFHHFIKAALAKLSGQALPQSIHLPLVASISPHPQLALFLPALLQSNGTVRALLPQNSGDLAAPLQANGYLEIPPGSDRVDAAAFRFYLSLF